jgi:alpha-L-fucosidase
MLMSLTPRGDGSIDPQSIEIMKGMGAWLKLNGEAIYATRTWHTSAEGPTKMIIFKKGKAKKGNSGFRWDFRRVVAEDIRFTRSKDNKTLYATALGKPESGTSIIKCLAKGEKIASKPISKITLIATGEEVKWNQTKEGLTITYPRTGISEIANSFKIEFGKGQLVY